MIYLEFSTDQITTLSDESWLAWVWILSLVPPAIYPLSWCRAENLPGWINYLITVHGNELHLFRGQGIPPYSYYYVSDGLLDNRVTGTGYFHTKCMIRTDTPTPLILIVFFKPVPEALKEFSIVIEILSFRQKNLLL